MSRSVSRNQKLLFRSSPSLCELLTWPKNSFLDVFWLFQTSFPKTTFSNPNFFSCVLCLLPYIIFQHVLSGCSLSYRTRMLLMCQCWSFESPPPLRQGTKKQVVFLAIYKFLRCLLCYFWLLALLRERVLPFQLSTELLRNNQSGTR